MKAWAGEPWYVSAYVKQWRKEYLIHRRQWIREAARLRRRKPLIHNGRKP